MLVLEVAYLLTVCTYIYSGQQKKKKQQSPKKRASVAQSERRNPSRKARPPEHFGLEQEPVTVAKPRKSVEFDLKKLMEVNEQTAYTQSSCCPYAIFRL